MLQTTKHSNDFIKLGIDEKTISALDYLKFSTPTPIQKEIIPLALNGKNVIGIAQTGTGKTLAFGIPMIEKVVRNKGQGLILVPTRELAIQVGNSIREVGKLWNLHCSIIIGGVSQKRQIVSLKNNPDIIIATPGRLADLINQGKFMLDEGFLPEITKILEKITSKHQMMLFSATMPKAISKLVHRFMNDPKKIEINPQGTTPDKLDHEAFIIPKNNKSQLLKALLEQYHNDSILIFTRTKYGAKKLAKDIRNMGHTATEIHSNRTQAQRKISLKGFADWKFRILVATDIASRGIDVVHISVVINFDLPDQLDDYVHRVGRTGRAGREGKAISFVMPPQKSSIKKIERLIGTSITLSDSKYSLKGNLDNLNQFGRISGKKKRFYSRKKSLKNGYRKNRK